MGEVATIAGSIAISLNACIDLVLEISKNGYKIDRDKLEEIQAKEEKKKSRIWGKVLGTTLLLLPGVNLAYASIQAIKMKKELINNPEVKEMLVPMTDKEKEQYEKMEGKIRKLEFTAFTAVMNEEEEFVGFIGKKAIIVDHGLTTLDYEELLPLDYTLDEVKRLNEITKHTYRIGKIDGKNVAIIGIPNPDYPISRIEFKSEDYNIAHDFKKMTDDEAKDKTFTVYPFMKNEYIEENLQIAIEEIKQSHIESNKIIDLKLSQEYPIEQDDVLNKE